MNYRNCFDKTDCTSFLSQGLYREALFLILFFIVALFVSCSSEESNGMKTSKKNDSKYVEFFKRENSKIKVQNEEKIDAFIIEEFQRRMEQFDESYTNENFKLTHTDLKITHDYYSSPYPIIVSHSHGEAIVQISTSGRCHWKVDVLSIEMNNEFVILYSHSGCDLDKFFPVKICRTDDGYLILCNDDMEISYSK